VLVFELLALSVFVCVPSIVLVVKGLVETVVVADFVFVVAPVAVPHELCVFDLELLVDAVYVAEDVDVFVDDTERVSAPDRVPVGEEDADPVEDIVGSGIRVRDPVAV